MKLFKQIMAIALLVLFFTAFNLSIFFIFTKPCLPAKGKGILEPKTISLSKYLPFDENSSIVKISCDQKISGDIPVLDGSEALYPIYSSAAYSLYPEESVHFDGEGFSSDSAVQMRNTIRGFDAVVNGETDIFIAPMPSKEQMEYAEEKGVELEFTPIGREAFVFIVNNKNPVDELSIEELKGIYTGKYTFWSEVGGDNSPINPITRIKASGSQTAMENFLNGEEIKKSILAPFGRSIGFSFRFYVSDAAENGGLKMLSVNGAYPDKENIISGNYPIVSQFYAISRKDNDNGNIKAVKDFLLSEKGQKIIEDTGYIPIAGGD